MSDSDIFDRLAVSKYSQQADLSDDDSVFAPTRSSKWTSRESADSDLEDLANEVSAIDTVRVTKIQDEIKKWEAVRVKARLQKVDSSRIVKVDKKIKDLQTELASITTGEHDHEISKLEREIAALESERLALTQKIDAKTSRLRQIKPYNAKGDWLNDPSQLGGHVVEGKFVDDDDGEDDYAQLSSMMAERRRAAQNAGQYNSVSSHVKITNPKPSRDANIGF